MHPLTIQIEINHTKDATTGTLILRRHCAVGKELNNGWTRKDRAKRVKQEINEQLNIPIKMRMLPLLNLSKVLRKIYQEHKDNDSVFNEHDSYLFWTGLSQLESLLKDSV